MSAEKNLTKYGFVRDVNNLRLKEVLKDRVKLKEIYIDTYPENPFASPTHFMLLLRTCEKNVVVSNDGDRVIFKKNDRNKTHFMNILFSKITKCFFRISESCLEFIFIIQNIYYRITLLN